MKKIIVGLFLVLVLSGCSKKEDVSIDTTKIVVSETGEFQVTGTAKENSSFYVNDQIITSKEQEKNGKFTVNVQMNAPEKEANFKIKYLNDELLNKTLTFDTSKFENQLKNSTVESSESISKETVKTTESKENEDITKLSAAPNDSQKLLLQNLANQKFKQDYPYKGSKLHSLTGRIQDWTSVDDHWFAKIKATIVNENGAERDATVEVVILPTDSTTGEVTLSVY
ncbi:membrane lipoprotein lipid attachment site-containing protein [Enterococcus thailandicus]|uniref:membrane lipoprotein lipid attachment site-containing protein n=1 Tax=Enterococcus thailandicus TaxID=417368 RepID=UPI00288E974B|nr:membrane lipoprotein lipid attachment site-containing protein [Enterococcus thailandicus]MDT2734371.1 membrane lipoprotein lipid attachment site-containing protein [Enterococcus thailandicus]MDT2793259.1 membrane lipoprotein lipid attachment site-containing protein [Enterococcus thailandicus]